MLYRSRPPHELLTLFARSKTSSASTDANNGRTLIGFVAMLLAFIFFGSCQSLCATPTNDAIRDCGAGKAVVQLNANVLDHVVRYEAELTGFAEIDAPGRQSQPIRVIPKHRCVVYSLPADHSSDGGLRQNLLVLKSPLALPLADGRPSLQEIEVRLQV